MPNGILVLTLQGSAGAQFLTAGSYGEYTGDWHFVAATLEFGVVNEAKLYGDGNEVAWADISGVGDLLNEGSFTFGGYQVGGGVLFEGTMDEMKVYRRALSVDELDRHHQDGLAGLADPNRDVEARTLVGDLKDLNITHGDAYFEHWDSAEVDLIQAKGGQIFAYGLPQVGYEDPEIYRRHYGHMLWKYDYDGAVTYAYQDANGFIWDESDAGTKDLAMAYPTENGLVGTVQWEGFREAVDDTRYRVALQDAIAAHPSPEATLAQADLDALKASDRVVRDDDLDAIRAEMVTHLLAVLPDTTPRNVDAAAFGATNQVVWEEPPDGSGVVTYRVYRDGVELDPAGLEGLAYYDTDPALQPSTQYTYSVRAEDGAGELSDEGVQSIVSDWDFEPPTAPGNLTANNSLGGTVNGLQWTPSTDNSVVALYLVYRDEQFLAFTSSVQPYYLDYAIVDGQTYDYQVFAWDDSYNLSQGSNVAMVTVEQ